MSVDSARDGVAIQDQYEPFGGHCFGCGRHNEHGHQLKSYWNGQESEATFQPAPYHIAFPGYVYGGLLASLIDCHGIGTAAAAVGSDDGVHLPRFVTASLKVDFLRPTPVGVPLHLSGHVVEQGARKVVVEVTVRSGGERTVQGRVIGVRMPDEMAR